MSTKTSKQKRADIHRAVNLSYLAAGCFAILILATWVIGFQYLQTLVTLTLHTQQGQITITGRTLILAGFVYSVIMILLALWIVINASRLKRTGQTLLENQEILGRRVQDRTAQISSLNLLLQQEVNERTRTERNAQSYNSILELIQYSTAILLASSPWEASLGDILAHLGQGLKVHRAYVYRLQTTTRIYQIDAVYEWQEPTLHLNGGHPVLQNLSDAGLYSHWIKKIKQSQPFSLNDQEPGKVNNQGFTWLDFPIMIDENVWGIMGVQDYNHDRTWSEQEIRTLEVITRLIATAISTSGIRKEFITSLEQFRSNSQFLTDMVTRQNPEGKIIYASPTCIKILGFTPHEMVGTTYLDYIYPDDLKEYQSAIQAIHSGTLHPSATYRFRQKNGSYIWLESIGSQDPNNGKAKELVFVSRDVGKRMEFEQAMRESEQKFRGIVEQSVDGIFLSDINGKIAVWNRRQEEISSLSRAEAVGHFIWDITYHHMLPSSQRNPQTYERIRSAYLSILESGQTPHSGWLFDLRMTGKDGIQRTLQVSTYSIRTDKGYMVCSISRDISERVETENSLAYERNLLRTLIDNSPDLIYIKDRQGRYIVANIALARFVGIENLKAVIGKTDAELYPAQYAKEINAYDQTVIQTGESQFDIEEASIGTDGNRHWLAVTKVPLRDQNGQITGIIGISKDITSQKASEEALRQANNQLSNYITSLQNKNKEVSLLNEISDLLQSCRSENDIYEILNKYAPRLFSGLRGCFYLLQKPQKTLESATTWGDAIFSDHQFGIESCWAMRRSRIHIVADPTNRLHCQHVNEYPDAGFIPYICQPMTAQGEVIGLLHVQGVTNIDMRQWETLTRTVAERIGMAISNMRLREDLRAQAIRDPLTNLFNRRFMEETLERELHRAIRYHRPLGLILLDIDHFKNFNDTFSYAAGDALLRELGIFLENNLRKGDVTCRYGGEEFFLILPESELEDTLKRAEQIRQGIKRMHVIHDGQALGMVTVSLGIASYPEHGEGLEELLRAVDTALHTAKRQGRDRLSIAGA